MLVAPLAISLPFGSSKYRLLLRVFFHHVLRKCAFSAAIYSHCVHELVTFLFHYRSLFKVTHVEHYSWKLPHYWIWQAERLQCGKRNYSKVTTESSGTHRYRRYGMFESFVIIFLTFCLLLPFGAESFRLDGSRSVNRPGQEFGSDAQRLGKSIGRGNRRVMIGQEPRVQMPPFDLGFKGQTETGYSASDHNTIVKRGQDSRWLDQGREMNDGAMEDEDYIQQQPVYITDQSEFSYPNRQSNKYEAKHRSQNVPFQSAVSSHHLRYDTSNGQYDSPKQNAYYSQQQSGSQLIAPSPEIIGFDSFNRPVVITPIENTLHYPWLQTLRQGQMFSVENRPQSRYQNQYREESLLPVYQAESQISPHRFSVFNSYPSAVAGNSYQGQNHQVQSHNAIGHPSNYREISDADIEQRAREYQQQQQQQQQRQLNRQNELAGRHQWASSTDDQQSANEIFRYRDSGLQLRGSQSQDARMERFKQVARQHAGRGVEAFFDDIDLNHDGSISLSELRNYMLLHEIPIEG